MSNNIMADVDALFALVTSGANHKPSLKSGSKSITHRVRSHYRADLFGKTFDLDSLSDLDMAKVILVDLLYVAIEERGLTARNPFHETWHLRNGATMSGHQVRKHTSENVLKYINEIVVKNPIALLWMSLCIPKQIIVPASWADNKQIVDLIAMFGAETVGAK